MQIRGTMQAKLAGLKLTYNEETGARAAIIKLKVPMDHDLASELLGEKFTGIAFGPLHEDSNGEPVFDYESLTPALGGAELHYADIVGYGEQETTPEIRSVKPIPGEARVTVEIQFPLRLTKANNMGGDLANAFGEMISVRLEPAQQALPGF